MATETLIIQVRADGTRSVQRQLKSVGTTAKSAASGVQLLKNALLFVGVVESIRRVVGTLASFSQSISTVRAITEATDKQFEALKERAKELGAETRFSATQASEGLEQLARAGFDVQKSIETVDDTLRLAQAGALDLGTAAQITAGLIRGFRVGTDQAERFVDVLAKTANSAATDVTDLGEAFKFVAPAAADLMVPFETASAALGILADNQLRASLGGTGLRKVLSTLAKGAPPLITALNRAGLTLEDIDIKTVGLAGALKALQKANIDTGEAFKIFGDRGQPAFSILSQNIPKLKEFTKELNNASGTARRIADVMDDNLNGSLLRVKSAIEAVILAFGDFGATSFITRFLNQLAGILRTVAGNAMVLEGVLATLGLITLPLVLSGIAAIGAAIVANPLGALSIALAGLIGFLVTFRDEIIISTDEMVSLGDFGQAVFESLKRGFIFLREIAKQALVNIVQLWNFTFGDDLPATFEGFLIGVAKGFDKLIGIFSGVGAVLVAAFANPVQTVKFLLVELVNFTTRQINSLNRFVSRQIRAVVLQVAKVAAAIPGVSQKIKDDLAKLSGELGIPDIPKLENRFRAQGVTLGEAFAGGVQKAAETKLGENLIGGIFDRSRQIGAARRDAPVGPTDDELRKTQELNDLLEDQGKKQMVIAESLGEIVSKLLLGAEAGAAFAKAMREARITAAEFGAELAGIVVSAIDRLSGAIADLVISGFKDFESFKKALSNIFRDLAREIIKLIIKFLILKAVSAAFGGVAGPTPIAASGGPIGLQAGGSAGGREPVIVGERGPELFTPTRSGNVTPNSQLGQAPINVTTVVVRDEEEVMNVLNTTEGQQAVLQVIGKNRREVGQLIRGG